MGRARAVVVMAFAAVTVVIPLVAQPAGAHVELLSSCPGAGELISDLPQITFTFDGPLAVGEGEPASIAMTSTSGAQPPGVGEAELVGVNALVADVLGPIPPGEYMTSYAVLSLDGDVNEGSVQFSYDGGSTTATNCIVVEDDAGDSGGVTQVLLLVIPLVAAAAALMGFNRWAKARVDEQV